MVAPSSPSRMTHRIPSQCTACRLSRGSERKVGEPCRLRGKKVVNHRANLRQGEHRCREGIEHDRVVDVLAITAQRGFYRQLLDVNHRPVHRRALRWQRAHGERVNADAIDLDRVPRRSTPPAGC